MSAITTGSTGRPFLTVAEAAPASSASGAPTSKTSSGPRASSRASGAAGELVAAGRRRSGARYLKATPGCHIDGIGEERSAVAQHIVVPPRRTRVCR